MGLPGRGYTPSLDILDRGKEGNSGEVPADLLMHRHAGHPHLKRLREEGKLKHHLRELKNCARLSVRYNGLEVEAGLALGQGLQKAMLRSLEKCNEQN